MEVICTGKITTFAGQSKYQIIVDNMEVAGEGALLKMLEDRRKKLLAYLKRKNPTSYTKVLKQLNLRK